MRIERADLIALTRGAIALTGATPMRRHTLLTVDALGVAGAIEAMAAVTGLRVEFLVEDASIREAIALARHTLVGLRGGGGAPRPIHIEGLTLLAVDAGGVVLTVADLLGGFNGGSHFHMGYFLVGGENNH